MKMNKLLEYFIIVFLLMLPLRVDAANKMGYNNAVNLSVRSTASTSGTKVGILPIGTNIEILGTASGNGCKTWYKFKYNGSDAWACGISTGNLEYIKTYTTTTLRTNTRTATTAYEKELQNAGFPSSYWDKLSALHTKYPNWNFIANKTNADFYTAVSKEMLNDNSLFEATSGDMTYLSGYLSTASGDYNYKTNTFYAKDSSRFYNAGKDIIAYYMDPRNFLNESFIFYFEQLSYNSSYHTQDITTKALGSSFLNAYKTNYYNAGKNNKVSPVHLVAKSRIEMGSKASFLTTGESFVYKANLYKNNKKIYGKTFSKCFNFYNIGAYADTVSPAQNAAIFACGGKNLNDTSYGRPWNTADKAINGGAIFLGNDYINVGQDTPYFQKFNTSSYTKTTKYDHQYMQNIQAPSTEGSDAFDNYKSMGLINSTQSFTFIIPVYNNMPEKTNLPNSKNPNNYLSKIVVKAGSKEYTVGSFDGAKTDNNYNVTVTANDTTATINATKVVSSASVKVNDGKTITLSNNSTKIPITVTAANGAVRTYYVTIKKNLSGIDATVVNAGYTVNNAYISKINLSTKGSTISSNIINKDKNAKVVIKDKSNKDKNTNNSLVTGDKIVVTSGTNTKTYDVVIYGDVNGDGSVKASDYVLIKNHILKKSTLSNSYKEAADVTKDGNVKASDYVIIKNYILGKAKINQ